MICTTKLVAHGAALVRTHACLLVGTNSIQRRAADLSLGVVAVILTAEFIPCRTALPIAGTYIRVSANPTVRAAYVYLRIVASRAALLLSLGATSALDAHSAIFAALEVGTKVCSRCRD